MTFNRMLEERFGWAGIELKWTGIDKTVGQDCNSN